MGFEDMSVKPGLGRCLNNCSLLGEINHFCIYYTPN